MKSTFWCCIDEVERPRWNIDFKSVSKFAFVAIRNAGHIRCHCIQKEFFNRTEKGSFKYRRKSSPFDKFTFEYIHEWSGRRLTKVICLRYLNAAKGSLSTNNWLSAYITRICIDSSHHKTIWASHMRSNQQRLSNIWMAWHTSRIPSKSMLPSIAYNQSQIWMMRTHLAE